MTNNSIELAALPYDVALRLAVSLTEEIVWRQAQGLDASASIAMRERLLDEHLVELAPELA